MDKEAVVLAYNGIKSNKNNNLLIDSTMWRNLKSMMLHEQSLARNATCFFSYDSTDMMFWEKQKSRTETISGGARAGAKRRERADSKGLAKRNF